MTEVLLVEKNAALRASRLKTLEAAAYHAVGVATAQGAAAAARRGSCDLIIADAGIPEMLEVLSSIPVPALVLVGEENAGKITRDMPMGLWALLAKPFTAARFRHVVAESIERAGAVKDNLQQKILLPLSNNGKLIVSEAEMNRYFKHVLELAAAETEADKVALLIADEKINRPAVKAGLGLDAEDGDICIRLGERVMSSAVSLLVNDKREADAGVKQAMTELAAGSLLVVPLLSSKAAIGAIVAVKTTKGAHFTTTSLEFLSILARQSAAATENANLFKDVEKQRQDLEKLLENVTQSQENERMRVAVEIHDGIGQQLIGAFYRLQSFPLLLSERKFEEARVEAEEIGQLLKENIGELRRVLAGLRPHSLDELGLISALRQEADRLTRDTDTMCRFTASGTPVELVPSHEAAIYRVVQEALTNVRKHACAAEAGVELGYNAEALSVVISDNGKGFELDQANNCIPLGHMGLAGMKERAGMLGGNLRVESHPGEGTLVVLTIPLKRRD